MQILRLTCSRVSSTQNIDQRTSALSSGDTILDYLASGSPRLGLAYSIYYFATETHVIREERWTWQSRSIEFLGACFGSAPVNYIHVWSSSAIVDGTSWLTKRGQSLTFRTNVRVMAVGMM